MKNRLRITLSLAMLCAIASTGAADDWSAAQREVLQAIEKLSASTAPDGGGADDYAAVLHAGFSRWTVGSEVVNDKATWVAVLREWFDDGWRVSGRESKVMEIHVEGDFAFTRRVVEETYLGPNGETSTSKAALAEVWARGSDGWLLFRVNAHPIPSP